MQSPHSLSAHNNLSFVSSLFLSGCSSDKTRIKRKDQLDDKRVRSLMTEHCPVAMKAYHLDRKETLRKLSLTGPAPSNKFFDLNAKRDLAVAGTDEAASQLPPLVTWDFTNTLLKSPSNREIASSVVQRVLAIGDPERPREAIKERVRTYFDTLKRSFDRIVNGRMEVEIRMRSREGRIARVSCLRPAARNSL